ncbi:MAG: DMT family transporter [Hyphomicrobiaceae bacterium]|nr:DMT family transporter [Hyphomicrobiaceae bacterium]
MLVGMAFWVTNHALVKLASAELPTGEIIAVRGAVSLALISIVAVATGTMRPATLRFSIPLALRTIAEIGAVVFILWALFRMPLANLTAILQTVPLVAIAASALFLGERVGPSRWIATIVGLAGVLLIIRPGTAAYDSSALIALAAVSFVALRDVSTKLIDRAVPTAMITILVALAVTLTGLAFLPFETWLWPSGKTWVYLVAAGAFVVAAYYLMVVAVRLGDVSAVSPFRYANVIWALLIGLVVWNEFPDALALVGTAIVMGAGLFATWQESRR